METYHRLSIHSVSARLLAKKRRQGWYLGKFFLLKTTAYRRKSIVYTIISTKKRKCLTTSSLNIFLGWRMLLLLGGAFLLLPFSAIRFKKWERGPVFGIIIFQSFSSTNLAFLVVIPCSEKKIKVIF